MATSSEESWEEKVASDVHERHARREHGRPEARSPGARFGDAESTQSQDDSLKDENGHTGKHEEEDDDDGEGEESPAGYQDFTEDGDVIQRIRSRASMSSDIVKLRQMRQKYREGFFEMAPDDPRRPLNWPRSKRVLHTLAFSCCTCSSLLAATVFSSPAFQLARQKQLGDELAVLAFSVYLLGHMIGPMLIAPLADAHGRKICVLMPLFMSGVFMCVCANAQSFAAVVVYRFLAGVMAAGPISCSVAALTDLWRPKFRASAQALFSLNVAVGVCIPPIFGALLVDTGRYGWRWAAWLGGLLNLALASVFLLFLDETLLPIIERRLAKNARLDSGYWGLHTTRDIDGDMSVREVFVVYIERPFQMLLAPRVFLSVFSSAFSSGVLFLLVASAGEQFERHYGFTRAAGQCALVSILVGFVFGCLATLAASQRYAQLSHPHGQYARPEVRLGPWMLCGWMLTGGLFIYGWCMRPSIHWIVPMVGLALVGAEIAVVLQGCANYLTDAYAEHAASVHSTDVIFRYVFGGVFPLFARQLFGTLHPGWGASVLAFIGIVLIPVPWVLYAWGQRLSSLDCYAGRPAI